jgi:hypothetical protein
VIVLSVLEEQLAVAHGLAIAAMDVTELVAERTQDELLLAELAEMRADARAVRARCIEVETSFGADLEAELQSHVHAASDKSADLAAASFKAGTRPIDAWSFLAMAEAAEVAAWTAVEQLATDTGTRAIEELARWALPIQRTHLDRALAGVTRLAELAGPVAAP